MTNQHQQQDSLNAGFQQLEDDMKKTGQTVLTDGGKFKMQAADNPDLKKVDTVDYNNVFQLDRVIESIRQEWHLSHHEPELTMMEIYLYEQARVCVREGRVAFVYIRKQPVLRNIARTAGLGSADWEIKVKDVLQRWERFGVKLVATDSITDASVRSWGGDGGAGDDVKLLQHFIRLKAQGYVARIISNDHYRDLHWASYECSKALVSETKMYVPEIEVATGLSLTEDVRLYSGGKFNTAPYHELRKWLLPSIDSGSLSQQGLMREYQTLYADFDNKRTIQQSMNPRWNPEDNATVFQDSFRAYKIEAQKRGLKRVNAYADY